MGKKRVTYDNFNDDKPPDHVVVDHHHHHHHHRHHHNHQKSKKIKPEARLLHTLNSHLKKLAKSRSRNTLISLPPPSPPPQTNKHHPLSSDDCHMDRHHDCLDSDHEDDHHEMGVFEFGYWKMMPWEKDEDLFGGDCVFAPDLVLVFEEDGSYIPDPIMNMDYGDEGKYLYDILELSSQEDMINEFLKVNLFVS